ncbi:MAG: hypothetical protein JW944_15410 [Deltaproteobacteria bacterium]|nr:hypothetical protein [Deltaproteobacteria bacterium]
MKVSLLDSFNNYNKNDVEYVFLDKSELRPKSKKMEKESELFNTFIVIFCEGAINPLLKNYIRFFPENKAIKKNLEYLANFNMFKKYHSNLKYFDQPLFLDFVKELLNVDYALLIQQDPTIKNKNRYALTHFHVKIDWPIADAAEDLGKYLRYIQNNLYENGDEHARLLQNKLFEYYGCHYSVGGRRTAALIAAQLLKKLDMISTVFISSSESRSMIKYSERGVSKFFLIKLNNNEISALAARERITPDELKSSYLYPAKNYHVGISEAVYDYTQYSKPPENGKLRRLRPAYNWLTLVDEFLHPKPDLLTLRPINYNWVYSTE